MDFIERWFHVSPDGGNGMLETAILISLGLASVALLYSLRQRKLHSRRSRPHRTDLSS